MFLSTVVEIKKQKSLSGELGKATFKDDDALFKVAKKHKDFDKSDVDLWIWQNWDLTIECVNADECKEYYKYLLAYRCKGFWIRIEAEVL